MCPAMDTVVLDNFPNFQERVITFDLSRIYIWASLTFICRIFNILIHIILLNCNWKCAKKCVYSLVRFLQLCAVKGILSLQMFIIKVVLLRFATKFKISHFFVNIFKIMRFWPYPAKVGPEGPPGWIRRLQPSVGIRKGQRINLLF